MVRLHFPDGTSLSGKGAVDVLIAWGRLQWTPVESLTTIKAALSDRAWAWSRFSLDPLLPADEFLTALDASTLCAVTYEAEPGKPREFGS